MKEAIIERGFQRCLDRGTIGVLRRTSAVFRVTKGRETVEARQTS
jgi:hypothetical protein